MGASRSRTVGTSGGRSGGPRCRAATRGLSYGHRAPGRIRSAPLLLRFPMTPVAPARAAAVRGSRIGSAAGLGLLAAIALLALGTAGCSPPGSTGPGDRGETGSSPPGTTLLPAGDTVSLPALVDRVLEAMPGRASNGYRTPEPRERELFLDVVEAAAGGDAAQADSALAALRYDARRLVGARSGDSLLVVAERIPVRRGWGTFVLRLSRPTPADVHVDHPLHDLDTPDVGLLLYRSCRCRWLFVAGAHRYANPDDASDMARSEESVFQGLWERVAGSVGVAVSVHGFAAGGHDEPISRSDVVLSNGGTDTGRGLAATDAARRLRDSMRAEEWTVGLAGDDPGYEDLAGTVNPQGQYANRTFGHGRWLQMELARPLRAARAARERVADVTAPWMRRQQADPGG